MMTRRHWFSVILLGGLLLGTGLTSSCSKRDGAAGDGATISANTIGAPKVAATSQRCFTGKVLTPAQLSIQCIFAGMSPLDPVVTESAAYAEVSYAWLSTYQSTFQAKLFAEGVSVSIPSGRSGWDVDFDCEQFALSFLAYSAQQYHRDAFRVDSPAPALAIVKLCYLRDTDVTYAASLTPAGAPEGHTILLVATDIGPRFYDPQSGIVTLSAAELASVYRKQAF